MNECSSKYDNDAIIWCYQLSPDFILPLHVKGLEKKNEYALCSF